MKDNNLLPDDRAPKNLSYKLVSEGSVVRKEDSCLVSDIAGKRARYAEYFEQLCTADHTSGQPRTDGLQAADANPLIDEAAPFLDEMKEAKAKLKDGKATDVCNISAELVKAGGEATTRGLHGALTIICQSSTIHSDRKGRLVVPTWKGKRDLQD